MSFASRQAVRGSEVLEFLDSADAGVKLEWRSALSGPLARFLYAVFAFDALANERALEAKGCPPQRPLRVEDASRDICEFVCGDRGVQVVGQYFAVLKADMETHEVWVKAFSSASSSRFICHCFRVCPKVGEGWSSSSSVSHG